MLMITERAIPKTRRGFTLVELSIVLVIIGLLIGGILVAQSMINTAKINGMVRQYSQYEVAIANFQTKFQELPGDSTKFADSIFGQAGDGDGQVNQFYEKNKFWEDLSIGTGLKGIDGQGYIALQGGSVIPTSLNGPSFNLESSNDSDSGHSMLMAYAASGTNYLFYQSISYSGFPYPAGEAGGGDAGDSLRAVNALAFDKKIDDGMAVSGKVIGYAAGADPAGNCRSGSGYNLSSNTIGCSLQIEFGTVSGLQ